MGTEHPGQFRAPIALWKRNALGDNDVLATLGQYKIDEVIEV